MKKPMNPLAIQARISEILNVNRDLITVKSDEDCFVHHASFSIDNFPVTITLEIQDDEEFLVSSQFGKDSPSNVYKSIPASPETTAPFVSRICDAFVFHICYLLKKIETKLSKVSTRKTLQAISVASGHYNIYHSGVFVGELRSAPKLPHRKTLWYFRFNGQRYSRYEGSTKKAVLTRVTQFYLTGI